MALIVSLSIVRCNIGNAWRVAGKWWMNLSRFFFPFFFFQNATGDGNTIIRSRTQKSAIRFATSTMFWLSLNAINSYPIIQMLEMLLYSLYFTIFFFLLTFQIFTIGLKTR